MPNYLPLSFRHLTDMPVLHVSPLLDECLPCTLVTGVEARVILVTDPDDELRVHLKFWRPHAGDKALYFVAELGDCEDFSDPLLAFGPPARAVSAGEQQYPELILAL